MSHLPHIEMMVKDCVNEPPS